MLGKAAKRIIVTDCLIWPLLLFCLVAFRPVRLLAMAALGRGISTGRPERRC